MQIRPGTGLTFDDVLLVPNKTSITSRFNGEIDLSTTLAEGLTLRRPIISANMDTVTGSRMALAMHQLGGMGIIHRFARRERGDQASFKWQREELQQLVDIPKTACIGVDQGGRERLAYLADLPFMSAVLIDVAHGHSEQMLKQIQYVKENYPHLAVIAGNVATAEATRELCHAGADCIKVGVGPGSLCTTRIQTGNGVPQLTAVMECGEAARAWGRTIIADGGIRNAGDVVKALAAGAHAVMIGNLFAGTEETPNEATWVADMGKVKIYRGMSSHAAQESWKGRALSVEGEMTFIPVKGKVEEVFNDLLGGILSGMSYQGAHNLTELYENATFIIQTQAGYRESIPHGLR